MRSFTNINLFAADQVTMEKSRLCLAILLVTLTDQICYSRSSVDAVEVFYVKPTGPTTECPSGDSPCHSLQYYANHSSFTSNSMFLFLEGEHHLDSVVVIRNVANLSLVGVSYGVKILCVSSPSGLLVREFTGLNIVNMTTSNCRGYEAAAVNLATGSDVSLRHVIIFNSSGYDYAIGLSARDIVGSFSISNSLFLATQGNILVSYMLCDRPSLFEFSNNELNSESGGYEMSLAIYCSNVQVLIADSSFKSKNLTELRIVFDVLTNNSILINNSIFRGVGISVHTCEDVCNEDNLHCSHDFIKFTGIVINSRVYFDIGFNFPVGDCAIFIENSIFSGVSSKTSPQSALEIGYGSRNDTSVQAVFCNVTFATNNVQGPVSYLFNVAILFVNCSFVNNSQSVIMASNSEVIFQGTNIFSNNSALIGGGIYLLQSSHIYLRPNTSILFEHNHAEYVGGAIYTRYNEQDPCFFHTDSNNSVKINFSNNTANISGSSLYGGGVNSCCSNSSCENVFNVFNISNTEADPSAIASDPYNVCLCEDDKRQPNCSSSNRAYSTHIFPGQEFSIQLAVVGSSFHGVVPGAVRAYMVTTLASFGEFQTSQASSRSYCEKFYYSVNSTGKVVKFKLIAEQSFLKTIMGDPKDLTAYLAVTVHLKKCPLGFSLSPATGKCVCDPVFDSSNVQCDINNQSFLRPANSWIGFIDEPSSTSNLTGVMFHRNCPIGYCLPESVSITSNTSDSQCEPHRTGVLCGKCEGGYSLTLGNERCAECSNTYLLLILPLAVAGLTLIAILFALNLTVTEGSINGLIFYTNVLGVNYNVLFSEDTSHLYWFVAWLNLDLGISTCLYDGMDGYVETWLQFVFPIYLWVIILVIIQFYSKFPALANRLGGENAVKVLATLLLLSYTKLQRTVATILSFTWFEYPDGVVRYVWLYDANLEFFKGKHLYLGIAGILVLVFLIIPYTLCLAFFQQLQACSGHRLFQWVNKLKPGFDAYAGPYKDKYRFWTGMLLVVRTILIILFTIFPIDTEGAVDIKLLIILVVSFALLMVNSNGTYKKWLYNYLESFFYLQLGVFAAGVAYVRLANGSITAVADTSIGLSLLVFILVVGYHVLCRVNVFKNNLRGYADIDGDNLSINHEREQPAQ